MAGTVVQSSTTVNFGGASTTLNLSLTGVTAGNSIIVTVAAYNATVAANITASDGTSYSVIEGTQADGSAGATASILWRHNVSSGNYTIDVTTNAAGGNRYGWAKAMEVSGLANAAPNVTMPASSGANGGTSNSPSTGSSSATSVSNCFVVAAVAVSGGGSDAGIDTPATTGYTNHWLDNDFTTEMAGAGDYKSVTSTGAQSASWGTLTGSYLWAASLAAFEETGGSNPSITSGLGQLTFTGHAPTIQRSDEVLITPGVGALAFSSNPPRVQNSTPPSAITYIGSVTGTTSATIPAHQAGDLIIAFAYRDGSNTIPTIPAGQNWTTLFNTTGANTNSHVVVYKKAASSGEATGTFTSATSLVVHVYRGVQQSAQVGGHISGTAASTTVAYNTITMTDTTGRSWIVGFAGHRAVNTSLETPPAGMTNRATVVDATDEAAGHDTNSGRSEWPTTNVSVGGTSSGWRSHTVEILSGMAFQPDYAELSLVGHAPTVTQAGGGVSITPNLGQLTLTGFAPDVRAPVQISSALGTLTIAGFAPSLSTGSGNQAVSAGLGALTFTGLVPTVTATANVRITAGLGALTFTGFAPDQTLTLASPPAATLILAGHAPTITVSAPGSISTGLGQLVLTGLTPAVFVNDSASITSGLGQLTLTGLAPTFNVTANTTVAAGLGALVLTGLAPSVSATDNQFAAPGVGELSITGHAPALSQAGSFTALPNVAALELIGFAPSVSNSGDVVLSRGGLGGPVRRNYIIKGKRYLQVTNEELAYLLARDMVDVARDDIKVVYKKSKPHKVSVNAWKELQDAFKLFDKPATDLFDDDEEAAMLLL